MSRVEVGPISGFPEWSPAARRTELAMLDAIRRSYELHGFLPIETPAVERLSVLTAKGGMQKQIYSLGKPSEDGASSGGDLGLHFDLTVPLARYVAQRANELTFPFRRYQMQKVWRGERAQRGRFREFYQCDIDIIGSGTLDLLYDAEIVSVIASVFRALGIPGFRVRISNRKVLTALCDRWGLDADQRDGFLREIDRHGARGPAAVVEGLRSLGLAAEPIDATERLLAAADLDTAAGVLADAGAEITGVEELKLVVSAAEELGVAATELDVDLTIARGLDYYTGTVYETFLSGREDWGSVCSGGRYDDLAGYFTNRRLPGVGVSIGLTRLFDLLTHNELVPLLAPSPTLVLVTVQDRQALDECLATATQLRAAGIATEVYLQPKRLGEQLSYCAALGIPFAVIIGAEEASGGFVTLRDLTAGEQERVGRDELVARVREHESTRVP